MSELNPSSMVLRKRLKGVGLTDAALDAAWPAWWSSDAEASSAAISELRFSLARKLGLDPRSLLDDAATPTFVWKNAARFKHLATEEEQELAAISSFGKALAGALITATPGISDQTVPKASVLRELLLRTRPYIKLSDLLSVAWALLIPVVHLTVFPCERKRMAAMAVQIGNRQAILLSKDSDYPAQIAFYLAHEIGHIALGHLQSGEVLVDMDSPLSAPQDDNEESSADAFALELLTGSTSPTVLPRARRYTARQLAKDALEQSHALRIEPGTLSLCFGYSTGDWATASAAMHTIYAQPKPVRDEVNRIAEGELVFGELSSDTSNYLSAVLGTAQMA